MFCKFSISSKYGIWKLVVCSMFYLDTPYLYIDKLKSEAWCIFLFVSLLKWWVEADILRNGYEKDFGIRLGAISLYANYILIEV